MAPAVPVEVVGLATTRLRTGSAGPSETVPLVKNRRLRTSASARAPSIPMSLRRHTATSLSSCGAADDGQGEHQGECRGDRQQPQADRVGVGAAVDVAHDQRRHEAAQAAGGADQAGHAADAARVGHLGDQGERRTAARCRARRPWPGTRRCRRRRAAACPPRPRRPRPRRRTPPARTGIAPNRSESQPPTGPHDHGDHHEAGHPVRGVGRRQAVGGLEVGRQVDRERDVAAERDGVEDAGLPGDREPGVGAEPARPGRSSARPGRVRRAAGATRRRRRPPAPRR